MWYFLFTHIFTISSAIFPTPPHPPTVHWGLPLDIYYGFNHCCEIHQVPILGWKFSGHPQGLCLHGVCHRELSLGHHGAGQGHLSRPGHQMLPKRTNLPGIGSMEHEGLQEHPGARGSLPPQQPPGHGPFQTMRMEPGVWKSLTMVFTVLKWGPDFESGAVAGSGVNTALLGTIYSTQNNYSALIIQQEGQSRPHAKAIGHPAGHRVGLPWGPVLTVEGTGQSCR